LIRRLITSAWKTFPCSERWRRGLWSSRRNSLSGSTSFG
jgi:hypothetical protein